MVRSGPVVAAAVAMLEQQTTSSCQPAGLRRIGAVSVLPRRRSASASASATDDSDSSTDEPPPTVKSAGSGSGSGSGSGEAEPGQSAGQEAPAWTDSARSISGTSGSDETASATDTDEHNADDHNTTVCDEDFQWVHATEPKPEEDALDMQSKFTDLYTNQSKDPGKPITFRSKSSSRTRKERDNKSKSSQAYTSTRYRSPSKDAYNDLLRRRLCYNCSTSCQELPEFGHSDGLSHRYGSTPGLDCHWLSQPLPPLGCYPCAHRAPISPYYCDQIYPPFRYIKSSSDTEEAVRRLEGDKERLALQVSVLAEQIDAQAEKINDLERALDDRKKQAQAAEDALSREMLSRSSLETQKLELLAMVSELRRQQAAVERDNCELRDRLADERRRNKPPMMPRSAASAATPPAPTHNTNTSTPNQLINRGVSPSPSPITNNCVSPRKITEHHDDINIQHQSSGRRAELQFSSLPRQPSASAETPRRGVAFGRGLVLVRAGDRSCSVPNLDTDTIVINDTVSEIDGRGYNSQSSPSPSLQTNKTRGIKKIFGKMKRSGSGNLDDLPSDGEFCRGGIRATAGGRLGWSTSPQHTRPERLSEWSCDQVCEWLTELGLECAVEARRWGKTGAELLAASSHDIDKELALKNPLHRKKLLLALHCERAGPPQDAFLSVAGALDSAWVLRWLDDAGLPQHKDAFAQARIDGRMLHRLTLDDLATLHITSVLHLASIRTGIQVLRSQNFAPDCLVRRSSPDVEGEGGEQDVALWTNHRVMEWLRAVDLAEYAPNLRGSGVHGGLLVHEPRFTGELMAGLLSIPPAKTLLRRHLLTHFKELLGRDVIQRKREAEASLGYIPLTTTAKIKVPKKSQFTLKRKKAKSELDYGELVCPLDQGRSDDSGEPSSAGTTQSQGDASLEKKATSPLIIKNGNSATERNTSV